MKQLQRMEMKSLMGGDDEVQEVDDGNPDAPRCGVKVDGVWYLVSSKQVAQDEVYVYGRATRWCCASCPSVMS